MFPRLQTSFDRAATARRAEAHTPRTIHTRDELLGVVESSQRQSLANPYSTVTPRLHTPRGVAAEQKKKRQMAAFLPAGGARKSIVEEKVVTKHTVAQTIISGGDKRTLLPTKTVHQVLRDLKRPTSSSSPRKRTVGGVTLVPEYALPMPLENTSLQTPATVSPLLQSQRIVVVSDDNPVWKYVTPVKPAPPPHRKLMKPARLRPFGGFGPPDRSLLDAAVPSVSITAGDSPSKTDDGDPKAPLQPKEPPRRTAPEASKEEVVAGEKREVTTGPNSKPVAG